MRIKQLADPVAVEPPRSGEDATECVACNTPDDAYIWVSERWRVRAMDRPTGLPMVLILECRSHLDLGDLPNLLAAELGVMTVRLERAIRSLDGVARVHVNRWGDGSAHLHMWFLARPYGRLQLRGTFLSLWDDILPTIPELQWRENLALVAAWLADFGGKANAEPAHIQWQSPLTFTDDSSFASSEEEAAEGSGAVASVADDAPPAGVVVTPKEGGGSGTSKTVATGSEGNSSTPAQANPEVAQAESGVAKTGQKSEMTGTQQAQAGASEGPSDAGGVQHSNPRQVPGAEANSQVSTAEGVAVERSVIPRQASGGSDYDKPFADVEHKSS